MVVLPKTSASCLILVLLAIATLFTPNRAGASSKDIETVRKQYIEYRIGSAPGDKSIRAQLKSLKPDGTWPDVDYADRDRSGWKTVNHLRRIEDLAEAYRKPGHSYAGKPELKSAIVKALKHWVDKDYKNPNWWYNNIGAPMSMANILVLMGNEVPKDTVTRAMATTMSRAKIGMTGQNKVWLAGIVFVRCLTDGNEKELKKARDVILSEVRVTTQEGIQPDWSFHQHGPQQQFGNYGAAFGSSITQWAIIFRNSAYALDDKQRPIIRNYLLEGPSWVLWKGHMDISGCGRQVFRNCQTSKGRSIVGQIKHMLQIDPTKADVYRERIKANEADGQNTLIGNKLFWRSDMMVHRRPEWYASVKMCSRRVIGAETCNSENMRGMHLADGVLYVYRTAKEYENIQPFWDWHRLPGTTCDQSTHSLVPGRKQCMLPTLFVGGLSDGANGVAVLDYKRDALMAKKAWFFEENALVCLGTGISATKSGNVLTSVQQSLLQGSVTTPAGKANSGKHQLKTGDWVHHAGIGYHIVQGEKAELQIAEQKGDWKQLFTTRGSSPQSGKVFSLWLDHGKTPKDRSYAYVMYPNASAPDMPRLVRRPTLQILSNTVDLQAVGVKDKGRVSAVFHKPGKFEWAKGKVLETDTPCIVSMVESAQGTHLHVAEPTQKEKELRLQIVGHAVTVKLPTGGDAGKTVKLKL